ncbi:hypothetical protein PHLCEN_2v7150 [Hermanssonia centrifuga]|uniref:Uncharacterized protein n=1 Tax=Hermanssonia centrifuga TaxID=98765 RepID=A0A2R6NXE8_9APHY|nr:hypothetical protein PHLCEN_2v7150 [Hermanssonia centrifuga]
MSGPLRVVSQIPRDRNDEKVPRNRDRLSQRYWDRQRFSWREVHRWLYIVCLFRWHRESELDESDERTSASAGLGEEKRRKENGGPYELDYGLISVFIPM